MLEDILTELAETWDYTTEELTDIRSKILCYTGGVLNDEKYMEDYRTECLNDFLAVPL
jgi:hypothetical protein